MENSTHVPYQDSPLPSRSSTPLIPETPTTTTKPLPSLPTQIRTVNVEQYRDEAPSAAHTFVSHTRPHRYRSAQVNVYFERYSDNPRQEGDDDDVPLAHLYPYPTEAPPAYHVAVRQSYINTLISHIPPNTNTPIEVDEEAGLELERPDDIRHQVEKVVAGLIVSGILLIIMAVLIGFIYMNDGL